jgi:Ca2+-binding EF-hand superfamily protein
MSERTDDNSDSEEEMTEEEIRKAQAQRSEKSNRAQLSELLDRMTPEDIFNLYDKDGSGDIDYEEFTEMLPQIGIQMGEAKALKFFRMCDRDGGGGIDLEEFKMALYAFDGEASNSNGYKPNQILAPHDVFEMFDENGQGELDEDELAFALEYLNLDVSGARQEYYMNKFDFDGSGALEYPEFRKMWLYCCNPFAELRQRGIKYGRFMRKAQARVVLEAAVIAEEELELRAMAEAHAAHNFVLEKKRR